MSVCRGVCTPCVLSIYVWLYACVHVSGSVCPRRPGDGRREAEQSERAASGERSVLERIALVAFNSAALYVVFNESESSGKRKQAVWLWLSFTTTTSSVLFLILILILLKNRFSTLWLASVLQDPQ